MSNFFVKKSDSVVAYQPVTAKVILKTETEKVFVTKSVQGPPGASWPEPFALAARFGEIASDPSAKAIARANLDLQDIDCGTFN